MTVNAKPYRYAKRVCEAKIMAFHQGESPVRENYVVLPGGGGGGL